MTDNDDVPTRLRQAALALFRTQGYDRTTAVQIAAQAGVTERTFFRYFPDKREVLFDGEAQVRTALTAAVAQAPTELGPLDTLVRAFHAFAPMLEANRSYSEPRQAIIAATPALRERELTKIASLTDALIEALKARGVAELSASLAARTGMMVFVHATLEWLDDPSVPFGDRIDHTTRELKALFRWQALGQLPQSASM